MPDLNHKPKIAVLLAAYNGMAYIQQQLETILSQAEVDIKIFISVDLSTDDTFEWCQQFSANQPTVEVLSYGDRFGGAAANFFRLLRDVDNT